MHFMRHTVAVLSILIFFTLLFAIAYSFVDQGPSAEKLTVAVALTAILFLNLPQLYLARFLKKTFPLGLTDLAVGLYVACFMFLVVMDRAGGGIVDLATIRIHDRIGLKTFVFSILNSSALVLVLYFVRALAMILVGISLRKAALFDPRIRPFRILMILSGLATISIVAAPLGIVFLTFSYWSLGVFLLRTKLGAEPKPSFRIIDDYEPS